MLKIGVYPLNYIDNWEKFNETSIPTKEAYYSKLNEEDISDSDYAHAQKVWDVFEIKNQGENHDLNVLRDTLLLADVFEKFRNVSKYMDLILLIFCQQQDQHHKLA